MLQQVVAVSMIGRALVLFFNLIPWARGGGKKKKIPSMKVSFSLDICSLHFSREILTEGLNQTKTPRLSARIQKAAGVV